MKTVKTILALTAVLLFVCNKYICDYVCGDEDLTTWWTLRLNLYAVLIGLVFIISTINISTKFIGFVLSVGVGFCISDIIDRLYFDINKFTAHDIIMIIITIALSYYNTYVRRK